MEKTAAGVPVQDPKQFCQPVSFCISEIVLALGLVVPGEGDGAGEGEGAAIALCVDAVWPPHPATAADAARLKTTRLGRNRFFSFSIWGTLSEWD
jgi:hypothetical protein